MTPPPDLDPAPLAQAAEADLLWPLARVPELRPHAQLESWYGGEWPAACSAKPITGTPRSAVDYVKAWCKRPPEIANALFLLLDDNGAAMRAAIRADLVDVLAAYEFPRDAWQWLHAHKLDDMMQALVATQLATGRMDHTYSLSVNFSMPTLDCHLLAWAVRGGDDQARGMLDLFSEQRHGGDTCGTLVDELACPFVTGVHGTTWNAEADLASSAADEITACGSLVFADSRTTLQARLFATALAARWPRTHAPLVTGRWLALARVAARFKWWGPELEDVATTALDNALVTTLCSYDDAAEARAIARELRGKPDRRADAARTARLDVLVAGACH